MAEQDSWKPHEVKPKPLLPVPSRPRTHYGGMQEFMGPFGTNGPGRKVKVAVAPFQWLGRAN